MQHPPAHNVPQRDAFTDYLDDPCATLPILAARYGVSLDELLRRAEDEDWQTRRKAHLAEKYETSNSLYREKVQEWRMPLVQNQFSIIQALQEKVLGILAAEEDMGSAEIRRLTESLSSLTASMNAMLGLRDALSPARNSARGGGEGGGSVNLFLFPGARPMGRSGNVIDVT